jgi:hypothetical protein
MSVTSRAVLYHFVTAVSLLAGEYAAFHIALKIEIPALLFIFGPLILFIAIIVWVSYITGIRCPSCSKIYGVTIGFKGWPSVPNQCNSCSFKGR